MKVLVALSGGVDSSTAAMILKERGYEVLGATMIFQNVTEEDISFAKKACEKLNIKYETFDFSDFYQKHIIENFINEYQQGRTPNPCIICNEIVKFGIFLERAVEMGFDFIATGHYARIEKSNGKYLLRRGIDKNEQSYFLYRLNPKQLSKILLPLGEYTKDSVRAIAKKAGLPTAQRKKSQDVCFLSGNYQDFLEKNLPKTTGPINDIAGKKIGEHSGIHRYTCGQRKGIGLSDRTPYYVVRIDAQHNAIYVGKKKDVYKKLLIACNINWIHPFEFDKPLLVLAKPRYFAQLSPAIVYPDKEGIRVDFEKPQWALTPGQSVVLYKDDIVLGGGIIEKVIG